MSYDVAVVVPPVSDDDVVAWKEIYSFQYTWREITDSFKSDEN